MGTIYMKRAVITGPTGSIGIALINELEANGIEVVAVVRPGSKRADRIKESSLVKDRTLMLNMHLML